MPLTLFSTANNYLTYKVQIAAKLAGVDLTVEEVKTVHDKTPHNKGPFLDTGAGYIFGSNSIMRYIARLAPASLAYGGSVLESALADQWIDFTLNEFEPVRGVWLFPVLKMMPLNMKTYNGAKRGVSKILKNFDKHLATKTYFVGNAPTIADAAVFAALLDLYSTVFSPNYRKPYVNLNRWFNTVAHHPAFAGVVGEVTFATEEKKAPAPPKKQKNQGGGKKNKQQQQQQQQQQQKPKKQKPKNPLDLLPKSSMIMDVEKKRFFFSKPFNPKFFEEYWPLFDNEGYSWYHATYQYNNEHKKFWLTENKILMYIQRLIHARKYAFGAMLITGDTDAREPPLYVEGIFMFRGQDVPFEVKDVPDSEYYNWTKIDVTTAEGKQKVEAYMVGEKVGEKVVLERQYFK